MRHPRYPFAREDAFLLMWCIAFAVVFNLGTQAASLFGGLDPILRAPINGLIVAVILIGSKTLLRRRFTATLVISFAAVISLGTLTFGPPSPLKLLFAFAGLFFDLGTGLRTATLRWYNLLLGLSLYCATVGFLYVWTIGVVSPSALPVVKAGIVPGIGMLFGWGLVCIPVSLKVFSANTRARPIVDRIRAQITKPQ